VPRRIRRDDSRFEGSEPSARTQADAPAWAQVPGYDVRQSGSGKEYRCPGCDHPIRQGLWHLVVMPFGAPAERRHWHTGCWRKELRRLGRNG